MKTLQTQYNLIKEGKGNKQHFMKLAHQYFPDLVTPVLSYNDTVTVLKNKSILSEGIGGVVTTGKKQDWHKIFKERINEYGEDSGGQDMTSGMYNRSSTKKDQGNKDFIDKGKEDYYDDVPFDACPYENGYNKYYKADLAKLWQMGWEEAKFQDMGWEKDRFQNKEDINEDGEYKVEIYGRMPGAPEDELVDVKYFNSTKEAKDWMKSNQTKGVGYELKTKDNKRISEAKEAKAEEKEPTKDVVDTETRGYDYKDKKNYDNVFGEEFLKGFYTEMGDSKNEGKTVEELRAIVAKNLAKDLSHYVKDGQFGLKGVGYTTEAPGLGTPKEAKGKHKSSGYGDLKESVLRSQIYLLVKEVLAEGIHDKDITSAPHTNVKGEMGNYDPKARAASLARLANFGPKSEPKNIDETSEAEFEKATDMIDAGKSIENVAKMFPNIDKAQLQQYKETKDRLETGDLD
jgi:hypothetical protein